MPFRREALVELRILLMGTVELQAGTERRLPGSPKQQTVLAALAWDAGRAVSVDTLIHRLWDDDPPAKPRDALRSYVSRIRTAMTALAGPDAPRVKSHANHYELTADPDTVDLRRYLALLDQSRSLAESGNDREALELLSEARSLWRGETLSGLTGSWVEHLRSLVAERALEADLLLAEILLRRGRYAEAAALLRPAATRHPAHESLAGRLALALHGSGRTVEATELLKRVRHRLHRDWGTAPGDELERIHQGILAHTPPSALLTAGPDTTDAPCASSPPDTTLPPDVAWVGRRDEVDRLTAALADSGTTGTAAVAVTGMPGAGKTALAVHAGHLLRDSFPEGRVFLDLRGHAPLKAPMPPTEALRTLLRLVGVAPETIPPDLDALVALWRGTARFGRFLVILDDAAGPEQVRPLLPGAGACRVVVTSRQRMTGLPGVRTVPVGALTHEDAVALVKVLMGERAPGAEEAAGLARLSEHLPLAITINASRLLSRPSWSAADLLGDLDRPSGRLHRIRDGRQKIADHFERSYRVLTPVQQLVFRRFGLHPGSEAGPGAIAALSGLSPDETDPVLEDLLAYHLVSEPSPHRYRMHDLLREYARELALREPEEDTDAALGRLVTHYLHAADQADRRAYPHRLRIAVPGSPIRDLLPHADPRQWFTAESPNLLAALDHVRMQGSPRELALMTHVLAGFLKSEGHLGKVERLLRLAAAHWSGTGDRSSHGRALIDLGTVCAETGGYDEAIEASRQALTLAEETADEELEAEARHQLSIAHWHTGRHGEALALQQQVLRFRMERSDRLHQGRSYNALGMICLSQNRFPESLKYFLKARARFMDVGDQRGLFIALNNLAELHGKWGNQDAAINAYQQAIARSQGLSKGQDAIIRMNLAGALHSRGDSAEALQLYKRLLPRLRAMRDRRSEAIARHGIGQALHALGRSEEALPHHTAAIAIARTIGAAHEECRALCALGEAECATGRLRQAHAHLMESLAKSREIGAPDEEAEALRALERLTEIRRRRAT